MALLAEPSLPLDVRAGHPSAQDSGWCTESGTRLMYTWKVWQFGDLSTVELNLRFVTESSYAVFEPYFPISLKQEPNGFREMNNVVGRSTVRSPSPPICGWPQAKAFFSHSVDQPGEGPFPGKRKSLSYLLRPFSR